MQIPFIPYFLGNTERGRVWWEEVEIMKWERVGDMGGQDDSILPQTFGWQNLWKGLA